jgi:integrase
MMRSESTAIALLRSAFASHDRTHLQSGPKQAGAPARVSAHEHAFPRSRGMQNPLRPRAIRPTFEIVETLTVGADRFLADRTDRGRKGSTLDNYRIALRRLATLLDDAPIESLSRAQVIAALDQLPTGSRAPYWGAWASCLRWLGRGDLVVHPRRPTTRRRQVVLDATDLEHWNTALDLARARHWCRRVSLDVIVFGTLVPMRVSEICAMRWQDVDVLSRVVHLPESKTGERYVPIGRLGANVIAGRPKSGEYVFPAGQKTAACPHVQRTTVSNAARKIFERYTEETGHRWPEDTCYHALRHGWASHALSMGVTPENVRQICGWSTNWQMDRYAHALESIRHDVDRVQGRLFAGRVQMEIATA